MILTTRVGGGKRENGRMRKGESEGIEAEKCHCCEAENWFSQLKKRISEVGLWISPNMCLCRSGNRITIVFAFYRVTVKNRD